MQKIKVIYRLMGRNSDHIQHVGGRDWRSVWTEIRLTWTKRDDGERRAQAAHLRSHPLGSASNAAGLLRLHRLPLGQVVGGVLLVFCVVGQGGFLHRPANARRSKTLIDTEKNNWTLKFTLNCGNPMNEHQYCCDFCPFKSIWRWHTLEKTSTLTGDSRLN